MKIQKEFDILVYEPILKIKNSCEEEKANYLGLYNNGKILT